LPRNWKPPSLRFRSLSIPHHTCTQVWCGA